MKTKAAYVLCEMTEKGCWNLFLSRRFYSGFYYVILLSSTTSNGQQSQCLHPGSPPPPPFSPLLCTVSTVLESNPGLVTADFDFSTTVCDSNMLNGTVLAFWGVVSCPDVSWQVTRLLSWGYGEGGCGRVRSWCSRCIWGSRVNAIFHSDTRTHRDTRNCTSMRWRAQLPWLLFSLFSRTHLLPFFVSLPK